LLHKLFHTPHDHTLTLLRLVLGIVFFAHGAQKMLGWFGGNGFTGTMGYFTNGMGIPAPFAALAILAEFLGALGLIFGLLTRIAAFGITAVMAVAIFLVHAPNGLFMNWTGARHGEGFEFHLLAIAIAVALIVRGAGAWSIDRLLDHRRATSESTPAAYRSPLPHHG